MAPEYQAAMRVSSAFVLVAALMTVFFGALRGLHRVVTFTLLQNVLLPTLRFAAVGLVVLFSGQLMDLVYAWTIPVAITAVVALWLLERAFPSEEHLEVLPSEDSPTETFRSFWGFSSARGVATVVETILEWIDVLVVTAFLGAAAGGVYGAVNRCVRVGAMIEHTGRVVTGPSISAALATRQLDRAREIFLSTTRVLTALSWPFYLSLAFFGPVLLGFFGKGFEAGAGILWVICPAAMLSMSAGGVQSVLLMSGKSRWQLLNKLSSLVVAVTLNFTLVPVWGLYGAVTAWASALLIDTFLASYQVFRLVGIRASVREMAPSLFLGAAVPTACALVSLTFLDQSVLGVIVYVVLLVPVYGAVLYRFRKALGIERFLSARRAKS
jgi:putative transporter